MGHFLAIVGGLIVATTVGYWIAVYVCVRAQQVPGATIGRALQVALLTNAVLLLIGATLLLFTGGSKLPPGLILPPVAVGWLALLVKWRFGLSWKPAFTVAVIVAVANGIVLGAIGVGLKTYVADSFVNPTNNMTPVIRGNHLDVTCANCGLDYPSNAANFLAEPDARNFMRPLELQAVCPNCAEPLPLSEKSPPKLTSGDRYMTDQLATPERWDVVCFRYPPEPSVMYGKRLVGLTGERIDLAGGDVFIDGQRVRKPDERQDEFWTFVHDTKYRPGKDHPIAKRWTSEDERWQRTDDGFSAKPDGEPAVLTFRGDVDDFPPAESQRRAGQFVNDIRLQIDGLKLEGDARLEVVWNVAGYRIVAGFTRSHARLAYTPPGKAEIAAKPSAWNGKLPREVSLIVCDGAAQIVGDGQLLVTIDVFPKTLQAAKQLEAHESGRLELIALENAVSLQRLKLERDVHYGNMGEHANGFRLGGDEFFFLGDNSAGSSDSRMWGAVKRELLHSVVRWIYAPVGRFRILR